MTVTSEANATTGLVGNGTAVAFDWDFAAASVDEVEVWLDGVLQTTGFTADIYDDRTGRVTFTLPPAAGVEVEIRSAPDFTRGNAFSRTGPFYPDMLNPELDAGVIRDIALRAQIEDVATDVGGVVAAEVVDQVTEDVLQSVQSWAIPRGYINLLDFADLVDDSGAFDDWTPAVNAWALAGRTDKKILRAQGVFDLAGEVFLTGDDSQPGILGIEGEPTFVLNTMHQRGINMVGLNNSDRSRYHFQVQTASGIVAQWGVLQGRTFKNSVSRSGGNGEMAMRIAGAFHSAAYYNVQAESNRITATCLFNNSVGDTGFWSKVDWWEDKFRIDTASWTGTPYLGEIFTGATSGATAILIRLGYGNAKAMFHATSVATFADGETITGEYGATCVVTRQSTFLRIPAANPTGTLSEVSTSTFQIIEAGAQFIQGSGDGLHAGYETNHFSDIIELGANISVTLPSGGLDPDGVLRWIFADNVTRKPLNINGGYAGGSSGRAIYAPYDHGNHRVGTRFFDGYTRESQTLSNMRIISPLSAGSASYARVEALSPPDLSGLTSSITSTAGPEAFEPTLQDVEFEVAGSVRLNGCEMIGNSRVVICGPYAGETTPVFQASAAVEGQLLHGDDIDIDITTSVGSNKLMRVNTSNGMTHYPPRISLLDSGGSPKFVAGVLTIDRKVNACGFTGVINTVVAQFAGGNPNGETVHLVASAASVTPQIQTTNATNPAANTIFHPSGGLFTVSRREGVSLWFDSVGGYWRLYNAAPLAEELAGAGGAAKVGATGGTTVQAEINALKAATPVLAYGRVTTSGTLTGGKNCTNGAAGTGSVTVVATGHHTISLLSAVPSTDCPVTIGFTGDTGRQAQAYMSSTTEITVKTRSSAATLASADYWFKVEQVPS